MEIKSAPIAEIKPYEHNPRLNDDAVDAVAASIRKFGWRQPIVVDEQGVIIIGHTRLKAAQKLGLEEVPVHVAVGLSNEESAALRLADNRTHDMSTWDLPKLAGELDRMGEGLLEDLADLNLDELLERYTHVTDGQTDPDDVPEPPAEPVTKPGDLWLLGRHVLCPKCGRRHYL